MDWSPPLGGDVEVYVDGAARGKPVWQEVVMLFATSLVTSCVSFLLPSELRSLMKQRFMPLGKLWSCLVGQCGVTLKSWLWRVTMK